ncbi:MAG: hypothetical protein AAFO68_05110 [Pseudomonadota bacterium]
MTIQFNTLAKSAFLAAAIAIGGVAGLGATSSSAEARSGVNIQIGGPGFSVDFGRGFDRHYGRPHRGYRRCTPRRALRKARRMGLYRTYVRRAGHRGVIVAGKRGHRGHVIVGFGKHRSCPVRFVRPRYR